MVSTMVHLAKELGYGAHVGSLQANFGSPYLGDTSGEGEFLVLEEYAVEGEALAGDEGASDSLHWSEVNLDVDGDGAITKHDLEMALAANAVWFTPSIARIPYRAAAPLLTEVDG